MQDVKTVVYVFRTILTVSNMVQKEFLYLYEYILYDPKFKLAFVTSIELSLPIFKFFCNI